MPNTGEVAHTLVHAGADVSPVAYVVFEKCFGVVFAALLTALGTSIHYLWTHAKNLEGLHYWVRRIALQSVPSPLHDDPFAACARVERAVSQRLACLAGTYAVVALLCSALLLCELKLLCGGRDLWSDMLLSECALFAVLALLLGGTVVVDAIRFGLPAHDSDVLVVTALEVELRRAFAAPQSQPYPVARISPPLAATDSSPAAQSRESTEPFATTGTMLKVGNRELGDLVNFSPEPFRPIVQSRMRACLKSLKPTVFDHERECVEHLSLALRLARTSKDYRNVDILAVCVDKTPGADYVYRYWEQNLEAARAGIYISRVFAYDRDCYDAMESVARQQSNAGINAYLISRDKLSKLLRDQYHSDLFGFTVVRGVDALEQVVLHAGVAEHVQAAAYNRSLLTDHFADIHDAIRRLSDRARPERRERVTDASRTPVQLTLRDRTLNAWRMEYDKNSHGRASMSVALNASHLPRGGKLERYQPVTVTANALSIADKAMRVSHVHSVDGIVCRRRDHKNCLAARDGDYFVGLSEVA